MATVSNNLLYIAKFGGFITDVDETHIPNNKFRELVNLELKNGELHKIKGYKKKYEFQFNSSIVFISQLIRHDNERKLFYFNNEGIYSEDENNEPYLFNSDYNGFIDNIRGLSFQDKLFIVAENEFPFYITKDNSKFSLNVVAKLIDGFNDKILIVNVNDVNDVIDTIFLPEYDDSLVYAKYMDDNYIYLFGDHYVYKYDFGNGVYNIIKWKKITTYKIMDVAFNSNSFNVVDLNNNVYEFDYDFNSVSINYQEHKIYIDKLENNVNNALLLTFIYKNQEAEYDAHKTVTVNEDCEIINDDDDFEYDENIPENYLSNFNLFVSFNSFFDKNFNREIYINELVSKIINFKDFTAIGNIFDNNLADFIINEIYNYNDNSFYHIYRDKKPEEDENPNNPVDVRLFYEFKTLFSYFIPGGFYEFEIKYKDKYLYVKYKIHLEKAIQLKILDNNDNEVYLDKFSVSYNNINYDELAFFSGDFVTDENILRLASFEFSNFGDVGNTFPENVKNMIIEKYLKIELNDSLTNPNVYNIDQNEYNSIIDFDNLYSDKYYIVNDYFLSDDDDIFTTLYDNISDIVSDLNNEGMSDEEIENYFMNNSNEVIIDNEIPVLWDALNYFSHYLKVPNFHFTIEISVVNGQLDEIINLDVDGYNIIKVNYSKLYKTVTDIKRFYFGRADNFYYAINYNDYSGLNNCIDVKYENGDYHINCETGVVFVSCYNLTSDYIENYIIGENSLFFNGFYNFSFVEKLFFDKKKYDFDYEINPYIYNREYNDWIVQYIASPYKPFVVVRNNEGNITGTFRVYTKFLTSLNTESESLRSPYSDYLNFNNSKAVIYFGNIPDNLDYDILKIRIYVEDSNGNSFCVGEVENGSVDWNNGYVEYTEFNDIQSYYKEYPILPKSKIIALHLDRLVISGGDENPNYIYFSETNYPEIFTTDGFITIQPNDGDFVTGLVSVFDRLYIFKNNYIYAIVGDISDINSPRLQISDKYGCISTDSIAIYKDTVVFLSNLGLCILSGNRVIEISKGLINKYLFENFSYEELKKSKGIFDFTNKTYRLYIRDKVIVTDLNTNFWIEDKLNNGYYTAVNFIIEDVNKINTLLFSTSFRYIFKDKNSNFFDGYERFCYLKTKEYKLSKFEDNNILYNISLNGEINSPLLFIDYKNKKAIDFKNKNSKFILSNVGNIIGEYIGFYLYESSYFDFVLKDINIEYG